MNSRRYVILIVDDEENALKIRRLVLEGAGYNVRVASGAEEAIGILHAEHVDLVLSDHLMPGLTGTELAKQIKRRWPGRPVVLLSGVNELPEGVENADKFISKTEGPVYLLREIATLLASNSAS